jgi:hypothetical protein
MSESIHTATHGIVDALSQDGCGYTLDLHRGNGAGHVVQWLWAMPVTTESVVDSSSVTASGNLIASQMATLGIHHGDTSPYTTNLQDEVGLLQECPFQPAACDGPHIVACGSGLLTPQ